MRTRTKPLSGKSVIRRYYFLVSLARSLWSSFFFGNEQLGEPNVTRSDVPALLALLVPTFAAVITGFVLAVRLSSYDDEFRESDDGATTSAHTLARHGLVLLLVLLLWPDRLNPLPAHIPEKSIAVVGGGAALIGGLVALAARSLLQNGKPTD